MGSGPSMYEFAGGGAAFLALADAHHRRCLADPELEHPFSHGVDPNHVEHLAAYWAEVFGGPPRYSGSLGGHSTMLGIHAGQEMEEELGRRFLACFVAAVDDAGLPEHPEFRGQLRAYMEWAVSEVFTYSPQESVVPGALPVPRWGWDGPESADADVP
jgi:hemoglobin